MFEQRWILYAVLAAVTAAVVPLLAKVGMEGINATVATAVRAAIMCVFFVIICTQQRLWSHLDKIRGTAVVMIALSAIAGALSWLFGFKALAAGGQVSQVAPIDKLSVPLATGLAFLLLRDRPTTINWAGIVLITFGAYLTAIPRPKAPGGSLANPPAASTTAIAHSPWIDSTNQ